MIAAKESPLLLSEITALWNEYMSDCSSVCIFSYFLNNVKDKETGSILQHALNLSEEHLNFKKQLMNQEGLAIPVGFTDEDVNLNAPRLFTDEYYLFYLNNISSFGMELFALMLRYITRADIRQYFTKCLYDAAELYNKVVDIQLSKGVLVKVPREEVEKKPIFPNDNNILKGLLLDNPRPMYAREVVNTFSGSLMDVLLKATVTGFGQVTDSQRIKDYMHRGKGIFEAHFNGFNSKLKKDDLPTPSTNESYVTDSTVPPFSNKLMMFVLQQLCSFGMVIDFSSTAFNLRTDLIALHIKYGAEIGKFTKDGLKLMISNGWYEQPPQVIRHNTL